MLDKAAKILAILLAQRLKPSKTLLSKSELLLSCSRLFPSWLQFFTNTRSQYFLFLQQLIF